MAPVYAFFLRRSFRIIFILIRYVATIAFYDKALKSAFKHCYEAPWVRKFDKLSIRENLVTT